MDDSVFPLDACEGNCGNDDDCKDSLVCYKRRGKEPVPGCIGWGITGGNYCADRPPKNLLFQDSNPEDPLGVCEGDCDGDWDCKGSLICFQRDEYARVPGCNGIGALGVDYCIESSIPIILPTLSPSLIPSSPSMVEPIMSSTDEPTNVPTSSPTVGPSYSPTWTPTLSPSFDPTKDQTDYPTYFPTLSSNELIIADYPYFPLDACRGNCRDDDDCKDSLVCFKHTGNEPVPGCIGQGVPGADYCADRPPNKLLFRGSNSTHPLGVCEGGCDGDDSCEGGLICHHRDGFEPLPGCNGIGIQDADYCIRSHLAI